jgi:gliding motility-associated-like protein
MVKHYPAPKNYFKTQIPENGSSASPPPSWQIENTSNNSNTKQSFMMSIKTFAVAAMMGLLLPVMNPVNAQSLNKKLSDEQVAQITSKANKPIPFVENKGQWPAHVLYKADVAGGQMLVTPDGMLIGAYDRTAMTAASEYDMKVEEIQSGHRPGMKIEDLGPAPALKGFGWRLNFIGGNKGTVANIAKEGENVDVSNFLTGDASTSATNAHSYNVITYKDVYPGIHVKYYTATGGNLENDIIVSPGAESKVINMQIEGVEQLKMDATGGLVLPTTVGAISIAAPVSYLVDEKGNKTEIKVKYHLLGKNMLGFEIPEYDKSKTLVIDPIVMRWATWIASNTSVAAHCHGVDLDAAGNIYVVSRGGNGLVTVGAFQTTYTGTGGAVILWISKYTEPAIPGGSGVCVWQTYLGGTATTNPYACSVGPDGYLYLAGLTNQNLATTYGTGAPTPTWTQRATIGGGQQCFVAKVAPSGAWAEVRDIGSASANLNPTLFDLRILPTPGGTYDLLATGYVTQQSTTTADGDVPIAQYPSGTQVTTGGGKINGYIFRLSSDLNTLRWTKQYTSSGTTNEFYTTAVDGSGHIWIGGLTNGTTNISYQNPSTQTTLTGNQDGWLMSIDSSGSTTYWSRYFNSAATKTTGILCMEVNQQKTKFVIGGMTTGLATSNIPTTSYQTTYPGGGQDFYVASIPVAGNTTTWGTYFGGAGNNGTDNMMGLNIDENNDVYVLGYTNSKFTPTATPGIVYNPMQTSAYDPTNYDAIFFKLSGATGDSLLYYTYIGGKSSEQDPTGERGIKFNNCRIYLAITSASNDFPLTRGTIDSVYTPANGSVYLPVVVSMANPPDLAGNSITSGGNQSIACGQAPQLITASTPAYIIPTIIRNGAGQTTGTSGAYPSGLPVISTYQWQYSINNGVTWTSIPGATTQNYTPAAIDSFTGTYLFRRTINGDYCSLTGDTNAVVTVLVTPAYAPPAITTNSPLCAGQTLTLSTPAQTGFTYAWSGPSNFTSTLQNPTIANVSTANVGLYYLTEKNTANGCPSYPDSARVAITNPLPAPTAGSNSPVCSGDTLKLTASGAGNTFSWTGPNGFTSSLQNPIIVNPGAANAGTYQVTQSNGGACVSPAATVTVVINVTPAPVAGNNGPVCSGTTLNLTASTIQGATYSWTGPNGFTSNQQNPSIPNATAADSGTYTVVATLNGCPSAPATTRVAISPGPSAPVVGSNSPVCQGTTLSLTAGNIAGATFSWTGPNGFTSTLQNPTINAVTLADSGVYSVVASISGCISDTGHTTVVITPTPTTPVLSSNSPVCQDSTLLLFADTIAGASYSWTGPNGFSSTLQNPVIPNATSAASGNYTEITSIGGCASGRGVIAVVVNTTPIPVATSNSPICAGATLKLNVAPIAGATFLWSGPNGFTSTLPNPQITNVPVTDSGTYSVMAFLNGCPSSAPGTVHVVINAIPPPTISNNSPLCIGDTLDLTSTPVVAGTYVWTGPNGFTSAFQNPVLPNVTTADSGNYTLVVVIKGCSNTAPVSTNVVINPSPTATIGSNSPICDSSTLNLTAASNSANATYSWTGPNGFTSNLQNPSITNANLSDTGVYTLTVTAAGCHNTTPLTTDVVINPVPSAPVTGSNSPVCTGDTLNLTATSSPGASYSWSGPNGFTSNLQNPSIPGVTLTAAGNYTVIATISGCPSYPGSTTVVVNQLPATPVVGSNSPICEGNTLNLTSTTVTGASFTWTGPNGFTSANQNPSIPNVTVSDSGVYSVIETVNGCNSGAASTDVTIYALPAAPVAGSNSPVCIGRELDLTADSIAGATYTWTGPGGFTSNNQNPIITNVTLANDSIYTVFVTINGCAGASAQVSVIVGPAPVPSFTSTAPQCANVPISFTNTGSTGAGNTYSWNFGTGSNPDTSTQENPSGILFATGGSLPVIFTINNGTCSASDTQNISILAAPKAAFVNDGPACFPPGIVIFTDSSKGATSWTWYFGNGATPATATGQGPDTVTYASTGTQDVTLIVSNGSCSDTTYGTAAVGVAGADFTSSVPMNGDNGCLGQPVNFYEIGQLGANAQSFWNFGFGAHPQTSTDVNPQNILYDTTGAKIVTHIVTYHNATCTLSDTFVHIITINPIPVTTFTSSAPVCSNTPVNFTNTGSQGVNYAYFWDFGLGASPSTSIAENPVGITYSSSGTKTVTFTITNGFYCKIEATQTIVIDSTPTASFSSTAPQCTGVGVDFSNSSTATGVTYAWNFGPGATPATSTAANPTGIVYSTPGTKIVTLVVTNGNSSCTATATMNININQGPVASFTSNAPQCSTVPINFINTGSTGGGWSYAWDFGLGATPSVSSAENPSGIAYSSSGSKTVSLTIAGNGCTKTSTQTIVINSTPTASFISNAPQCTGQPVNFTSTGTSTGVRWFWNFGSGATPDTSSAQNPSGISYSTAGLTGTTLIVTDTASGCSSTASQTYNINQTPTASFISNAPQCSTVGINFTNTGSTGSNWSYSWDLGQGAVPAFSSSQNPSGVMYSSSGTKTITFTIASQYCTQTSTQTIVINQTPVASFTSTAPQCTGLGVDFTNTGTLSGVTYSWDFGAGAIPVSDTAQSPSGVIYSTAGTKNVSLTVTDTSSGCSVTAYDNIIIHTTPVASFTSNAPQCSTVPIDFVNTGSTGGNWSYSWDFGQGANPALSSSENPSGVMYSSSGTKTVTFTISDQNCTQSATQNIVINATPTASFVSTAPQCTGLGVDFTSTGTNANVSWSWSFGSGSTPNNGNVQNPSGVVYSTAGNKTVTLTVTDTTSGCSATTTNTFVIHQTPTASFTSNAPQCSTVPINFTNTGSTGNNWFYSWNFGQNAIPAVSSSENPTGILYSSSGSKIITFTISDQNCTQTVADTIVVNQTPTAAFTSTAPQCTGLPVNFNNGGTLTGVSWLWNFGPGATPATDTAQDPTGVIYSTAGTKNVTLTTTDTGSGCSVTATLPIAIHQTPTASFTSNAPQCSSVGINFVNTGSTGGNWSYSWNFGTGAAPSISTGENPTGIMYGSSGSKVVTFTISGQGCTQTTVDTISILQTPTASFTSNAPKCTGLPVNFVNTGSSNGVNWLWNFGPGATPPTSTQQYPSGIIYSTSGIINVTLTISDSTSSCSVTANSNIVIYQTPTATFTSNAPQCTNSPVNFVNTGSAGGNWTYDWDFGQGAVPAVSSTANPTGVLYDSSGYKIVTFTIADANCAATVTDTITISPTPIANFTSTAPQCSGLPVNFTNTGSTSGVNWLWNLGTSATPATSNAQNPGGVTYSTAGITMVTLTITDTSSACSASVTNTINIYQTPTASFTSTAPQCTNAPVNFTNTGSSGSNWSFAWDFGSNATPAVSSSENTNGVLYDSSGTKLVTFTISDAHCSQTVVDTIVINKTPTASFTSTAPVCSGLPVNFANTGSTTGVNWSWNLGTGSTPSTSSLQNPTGVTYDSAGIITVSLTITDAATSCANTAVNNIVIYQTPTASFTSSAPQCANSPINFNNTGSTGSDWSFAWDFGQNALPPVSSSENPTGVLYDSSGTRTVTFTISDAHCSQSSTQTITISPLPIANAGPDTTICANVSVVLGGTNTTPGATYVWFPSSTLDNPYVPNPVAHPTAAITNYSVTVTSPGTGCVNVSHVVVTMLAPLIANPGVNSAICLNDSVQIGAGLIEGQFYQWIPATGLSSTNIPNPVASPTQTTTYTLIVTDTTGCAPVSDQVTVTVNPLPNAEAGPDDTIQIGGSVQLTGTGGVQYTWAPAAGLSNAAIFNPVASPDSSTVYVLTVTNVYGCQNTDTMEVHVFNYLQPYWIPTTFTPNGDGHNDVLYVRGGGFLTFEFSVFNRYGEQIFDSKDINEGWDGKAPTGQPAPIDAYVYKINGVLNDGTKVDAKGLVNLVR